MALIKFGAVITDSRGSLGGTTFKSTRAGSVMQTRSYPIRHLTQAQSIQRARLAELGVAWYALLSESQRTDWTALAIANPLPNQWGDMFPLSGVAFFNRVNLSLAAIDELALLDAPADQAVTALATVTLTVTAPATASMAFTASPVPADHVLLIQATNRLSVGQSYVDSLFFQLTYKAAGQTSPVGIGADLAAAIGDLNASSRYAVRATLVHLTNGARSTPIVASAIAT